MEKEKFNLLSSKLEEMIHYSDNLIYDFGDGQKIIVMTNEEFCLYYNKIQHVQSKMDKFNTDFYHLVGMGNLSAAQLTKLCKIVKIVEEKRHFIKRIIAMKELYKKIRALHNDSVDYKITFFKNNSFVLSREINYE